MHQQNGDRSCKNEAIGGQHWGPVQVYMSKVADASSSSADGSSSWFKVFQDTWAKAPGSSAGDADYWGTKDLTTCCGRMNVLIPADIAPGDYLLRAEALALHAASVSGGYQFYVSCCKCLPYDLSLSDSSSPHHDYLQEIKLTTFRPTDCLRYRHCYPSRCHIPRCLQRFRPRHRPQHPPSSLRLHRSRPSRLLWRKHPYSWRYMRCRC